MSPSKQRYISEDLIHFVGRGLSEMDQFDLLQKIIKEGRITHPPHNPNVQGNLTINGNVALSKNEMYSPEITCFADIPQGDIELHIAKYSPFGLSFSKNAIAASGGVPVHYLPVDAMVVAKKIKIEKLKNNFAPNHNLDLAVPTSGSISKGQYFDRMVAEYQDIFALFEQMAIHFDQSSSSGSLQIRLRELSRFFDFHIFSYLKFFDHKKVDDDPDNFYFEREWRIVGNFEFSSNDIKTVYLPKKFAKDFYASHSSFCGQVFFTD